MTFRWWEVQGVFFSPDICDPELVQNVGQDHGRIAWNELEKIMVCGWVFLPWNGRGCSDCKAIFLFFFQKKVSCTRHLWISFYDSSGGRLVWPHVTSLYIAKKNYNWQQLVKCAVVDLHHNGKVGDFHWDLFF